MLAQFTNSMRMLMTMTCLTGVAYPFLVTSLAQLIFPHQSNGSLIILDNRVAGSELIGQSYSDPKYFWSRLSATGPYPYNAAASTGSNYGPLHPDLRLAAEKRIAMLTADGSPAKAIPVDLVTASGSGLDPHISPAAAEYQVARVAKSRRLSDDQVRALVSAHTEGRQFGVLGEPRVHVLRLNLALDQLEARK